jgi:hypothetical protein
LMLVSSSNEGMTMVTSTHQFLKWICNYWRTIKYSGPIYMYLNKAKPTIQQEDIGL